MQTSGFLMSSNQDKVPLSIINETQLSKLSTAVSDLNRDQLIWASGYLAGLSQVGGNALAAPSLTNTAQTESKVVTVLFGSQTGNAKHAAIAYAESAKAKGFSANVVSMADYKPRKIKDETHLIIFVSTHGEGDAPDDAVELHEFLGSKKAPKLDKLKYAVVGLGDSSYEFFCQTGKDFETRLQGLGATAIVERLDCDVEYEAELAQWTSTLNEILAKAMQGQGAAVPAPTAVASAIAISQYTKKNPYSAVLTESIKITGIDSVKENRPIEISTED